jgi:hypothetical protein
MLKLLKEFEQIFSFVYTQTSFVYTKTHADLKGAIVAVLGHHVCAPYFHEHGQGGGWVFDWL